MVGELPAQFARTHSRSPAGNTALAIVRRRATNHWKSTVHALVPRLRLAPRSRAPSDVGSGLRPTTKLVVASTSALSDGNGGPDAGDALPWSTCLLMQVSPQTRSHHAHALLTLLQHPSVVSSPAPFPSIVFSSRPRNPSGPSPPSSNPLIPLLDGVDFCLEANQSVGILEVGRTLPRELSPPPPP